MTMFGIAALIGPIVGPTLGGWLVVNYDWRWIFFRQRAGGTVGAGGHLFPGRGSGISQAGTSRVGAAPAAL